MGRQVFRVAKDVDRYGVWSSVVDDLILVGTREEVHEYLLESLPRNGSQDHEAEYTLARADEHGASAYRPFDGLYWDGDGEIAFQRWWFTRAMIEAYANAVLDAPDPEEGEEFDWGAIRERIATEHGARVLGDDDEDEG